MGNVAEFVWCHFQHRSSLRTSSMMWCSWTKWKVLLKVQDQTKLKTKSTLFVSTFLLWHI